MDTLAAIFYGYFSRFSLILASCRDVYLAAGAATPRICEKNIIMQKICLICNQKNVRMSTKHARNMHEYAC